MPGVKLVLFIWIGWLLVIPTAQATHLRSADIRVEPVCDQALAFTITIVAYLNTGSMTRFGTSSEIQMGDGNVVRIPLTNTTPRPDLGTNIGTATFITQHTYRVPGVYTITYVERNRSTGVLNIQNSMNVPYASFVTIDTSPDFGCNHYPVLAVPPIDRACLSSAFLHVPGAYDVDGDSLGYVLAIPANGPSGNAPYTAPTATRFYTDFNHGNEEKTGPPVFSINPLSGLVSWDSPGMVGEYNIAFQVTEWRKNAEGKYRLISTTTRDMQVIVEECENIRPNLIVPSDTCVVAGSHFEKRIFGTDEENHPVMIEVFSEILDAEIDPATYSPQPEFRPSDPAAEVRFAWTANCTHVRQQSYQVVFKITDYPPKGVKQVNFKIWNVRVVAPAPVWSENSLDLVKRTAKLEWEDYGCEAAGKIQVWRKVGSYNSGNGYCDTRPPSYWGYHLISEVPSTSTSFLDTNFGKGLAAGAVYCYRLAVLIGDTRSYTSEERCVGPIGADAPVITHVSVEKTAGEGLIRVSWRSPFGIDKEQFPAPYEYEVYRANGFIGDSSLVRVGRSPDTTWVDSANSRERIFNYRIVLFSKPANASVMSAIDTSSAASTIRLSAIPGQGKISLSWRDSVAWSNVVEANPYHLIYRSKGKEAFSLIDSVDVTRNGFRYEDIGKYKSDPIENDQIYSYRVMTRGSYGNPLIDLQENFSQVVSLHPKSDLLPCRPTVTIEAVDCESYVSSVNCGATSYSNTISWHPSDLRGCRKDIVGYNVYASRDRGGDYERIAANTTDTVFVDRGLMHFARCYRISAIDELGQAGPLSDSVCNDNCPSYSIPNVFTPNGDGFNDSFHTRSYLFQENATECPRFVQSVDFRVYNRWGKEVYRNDATLAEIEWDGRDEGGGPLDAGVYYYTAWVTFEMLDAGNRRKDFKGWIHVVK